MSDHLSKQLLNVARTYARRKRFWVLGSGYVFLAFVWGLWWTDAAAHIVFSACVANVLCAFIGLHLRRQFGSPQAKLLPGFAVPHLMAAGLVALVVIVAVPAGEAWVRDLSPVRVIAIHTQAAFILALVCIWPKAILLTAVAPLAELLAMVWLMSKDSERYVLLRQFLTSDHPLIAVLALALAVLAYGLAAMMLLRLSDLASGVDDDVSVNLTNPTPLSGSWNHWTLKTCDARVVRGLVEADHGGWNVQRWRLSLPFVWWQIPLAFVGASLLALVPWFFDRSSQAPGNGLVVILLSSPFCLVMPYQAWVARRGMLDLELLRPVSRVSYVRQLALALATDVLIWSGSVALFGGAAILVLSPSPLFERIKMIGFYWAVIWSLSLFLFGIAVFTFRWRMWMPIVTAGAVVWLVAPLTLGLAVSYVSHNLGYKLGSGMGQNTSFALMASWSFVVPIFLSIWTYRRWLSSDIGIGRG